MKRKSRQPPVVDLITVQFSSLEDPRIERTKRHPLVNVLTMALIGAICGADGWEALADFAEERAEWYEEFLDMPHGTPSADTFRRVFCALDPQHFAELFRRWVASLANKLAGEVVAVDGKALRSAVAHAGDTTPVHLLHVFATQQQLLLAQRNVGNAPGEVRAIPELLELLDLRGAVVTVDANGCTAAVTDAVRAKQADYFVCIKGNRGPLHAFVAAVFEESEAKKFRGVSVAQSEEVGHGRNESRTVRALPLKAWPTGDAQWTDVNTAVMIDRTRQSDGYSSRERHYYITSLTPDAEHIAKVARGHWSVENQLHWQLDVSFGEDSWRMRDRNGVENFGTVARFALALLKRESTKKRGIAAKRRIAGWSNRYLMLVLAGGISDV
jgi:predicted transposase YbfD/YdcC